MSPITVLYLITGVLAAIIAVLLVRLAMYSGQAKLKIEKSGLKERIDTTAASTPEKTLSESISEEIKTLTGSVERSQEASKKFLYLVEKEVGRRVQQASIEVGRKYEAVLEEKKKEQEVVWQKYNKALAEKKETEAVVHSVAEGMVVVNPKGEVIMMNPAAERLLGIPKKNKIGKSIFDDLKDEQLISLMKTSSDGKEKEIEMISPNDATKKTLRASSAVIEDENGTTIGMVSVLSDVTKQKELDRMKSSFIASVSHELRTPLVAISSSLSVMLSDAFGPLPAKLEEFLAIVERNLNRLSRLIDDLLDMSKLEAGKLQLRRTPVSIEKILAESVETLTGWANTKAIKIEKRIEANLPVANVDPDRITQIATNLISNAIKYSPQNSTVAVEASLSKTKTEIEIRVADSGMGIEAEHVTKIFDKFYRIENKVTGIAGVGLGLAIVKELVTLHGGRVWAESEKNKGSRFIFTLPLQ